MLTVAVFLSALIFQTGFLLLLPSSDRRNESADYFEYYSPVAQNILSGRGIVDTSGKLSTSYPPGFPVYLAAAFYAADALGLERTTFILCLNLLLMSLAAVLVFWTAERIFGARVALLSAALWVTYPFNLWLIKQPNSDVPFIPLLYGAIYCMVRTIQNQSARYVLACGLLLGVGALIRPIALFLPLLLGGAILLNRTVGQKKRMFYPPVLIGVFCLALLPWEAEVYAQTRQIVPLSTNGPSSMLDGFTFMKRAGRRGVPEPAAELMERTWDHRKELKTTGAIVRYGISEATQNPIGALELIGLKLARSWFGTDTGRHERSILLIQLFYLVLGSAGVFLASRRFPERRYYVAVFGVLVLYFWGMAVVAMSILRYLVPTMAYVLILGAVTVDAWLVHRQKLRADHAAKVLPSS